MSFDLQVTRQIGDCSINTAIKSDEKLIAIAGPSGIGKTTLLNCIAGLVTPDTGHIAVGGKTLFDSAKGVNLPPHERGCGYVFQDSRLFPHKKVGANLLYGLARQAGRTAIISLEETIELLDIGHLLDRYPVALSGGEAKRVAIGRALLSVPSFLLLDEPLASLDFKRGEQVLGAIERIRDELALPIIYVSHDHREVARLAKVVLTLD